MTTAPPLVPCQLVLPHRRVLAITGPDASSFLQAQLTADVLSLAAGAWRLAGYCSAKGRLIATGLLWRQGEGFAWLVADSLAEALAKRLRMFVLRQKVVISMEHQAVVGRIASEASAPNGAVVEAAAGPVAAWLGLLPVAGMARAFGIVADQHVDAFLASPDANASEARATWDWLEVRSGVGLIEVATQDRFVPQMVNLEALGGVDFKKGCYPGQEVVARSQYLGKLKRRTLLAHAAAEALAALPTPGSDVFTLASMEPIGTLLCAARDPNGGIDCLVEAPLAAWSEGLTLGPDRGGSLEPRDLPYLLPDNEVFVRPRL